MTPTERPIDLVRCVAVDPLGGPIPVHDRAVECGRDHAVFGGFDQADEPRARFFRGLCLGDVLHVHRAKQHAPAVALDGGDIDEDRKP